MLKEELHALEKQLEDLVLTLPGIAEMLTVPGVGMVTVIELCGKLVRVLYTIGQKQCPFDEERMIRDILHLFSK